MHCTPRLGTWLPAALVSSSLVLAATGPAAASDDLAQLLRSALAAVEGEQEPPAAPDEGGESSEEGTAPAVSRTPAGAAAAAAGASRDTASRSTSKYPPYAEVTKDAEKQEGLITLWKKDDQVLAELSPRQLNRDFIVLITIARGIGQRPLLGGYSWGFGDDAVWQFRRVGEKVHLVRRNLRFTAEKGSPTERAVDLAYTDSVLFSLPIRTVGPQGSLVVDLTPVFMSDLPQISLVLPGFSFARDRSTWAAVEGYPKNVELQVAATYSSSGGRRIESVADTRGVTVNIHYSISELPKTSYRPRLADDRVGYFLTVLKDFSKKENDDDRFVRYINRWNLEKSEPNAKVSTPKQPIVFYLEKTVPFKYRKPIRDGILEWNKAFEKAGFYDAIEVRQQPDDATWEPGDIRYNTYRWITARAGFAMGPSRVNPLTGEILNADIIFDADFLQFWKQEYETFTPESIALLTGGPIDLEEYRAEMARVPDYLREGHSARCGCTLMSGMSKQFAVGATVLAGRKRSDEEMEKLVMQGLKDIAMHEVGHTLGLRHNFKASTLYSLEELQDVEKTSQTGLGASVMDYTPVNLVPSGMKQGDYFSTTIGPYDMWAIEYGYTPLKGNSPEAELPELQKIAARSGEPGLAYGSDENARGIDPDPHSVRYDLGDDAVKYAHVQAQLVAEAWPNIVEDMTKEGEGYQRARRAFMTLLARHGRTMFLASRYVGGLYVSRSHRGDEGAPEPVVVVPAEKQREALALVEEQVFSDTPFNFPPEIYSHLAASHWSHWGTQLAERTDFPAHEAVLLWQQRILSQLMSSLTLTRLHDSELKVPADEDALTTAELLERLTQAIFSEIESAAEADREFCNRNPAISSLRRNVQREYLQRLSRLALGQTSAPQDCQTIAFAELMRLKSRADALLASDLELDSYTRAHLQESTARITKVLDAKMLTTP